MKFKIIARIRLGKYSVQMLVFVADVTDECMGCDFLNKTGISNSI